MTIGDFVKSKLSPFLVGFVVEVRQVGRKAAPLSVCMVQLANGQVVGPIGEDDLDVIAAAEPEETE